MTASGDEFDALRTVIQTLERFAPDEQKRILRWAAEKIGVSLPAQSTPVVANATEAVSVTVSGGATDIRAFTASKSPKNDIQFVTLVAYYHRFETKEIDRKDAIKAADVTDACRKADWKRIPRPDQTLINAVNAGLLDRRGSGEFVINSVGENLVALTLPGGDASSVRLPRKSSTRTKKTTRRKK